jgi:hypothetical protein
MRVIGLAREPHHRGAGSPCRCRRLSAEAGPVRAQSPEPRKLIESPARQSICDEPGRPEDALVIHCNGHPPSIGYRQDGAGPLRVHKVGQRPFETGAEAAGMRSIPAQRHAGAPAQGGLASAEGGAPWSPEPRMVAPDPVQGGPAVPVSGPAGLCHLQRAEVASQSIGPEPGRHIPWTWTKIETTMRHTHFIFSIHHMNNGCALLDLARFPAAPAVSGGTAASSSLLPGQIHRPERAHPRRSGAQAAVRSGTG